MDRASQVLALGVPHGVPKSYRALADHHGGVGHTTLYYRDNGRQSIEKKALGQHYLNPYETKAVVQFLLQMSNLGQPVRIKYIPSIAFLATRHRSVKDRPRKPPGRNWAKALEKRNPELKARRVKALDWNRHERNIYEKITDWFIKIGPVVEDPIIRPENVWNFDETGVILSKLGSVKVLVGKDDMRDYRGAREKRTMVTAIECISSEGGYLTPMIIWPATTHRSNWTTFSTPGWQYACSESGYTDSKISLEWLKRIFDPQTKERANGRPRVLISDGFATHETLEILEYCFGNNIIPCRLPSHTSHKLQPCDVAVFAPLKAAYRDQVEILERGGVNTIDKQHFTALYSPAREKAFTSKNIKAGFAATGLFPFNPDRVLRGVPKPPPELTIPSAIEATVEACPQDTVLCTPVTPVSEAALISLQDRILKCDAHALDDVSKENLNKHIQKITKAARVCLAKSAIQNDQIRFLLKINNEAKVRRSTKSEILGRAKVMSFEDLEEARSKRAQKEDAKNAKGKGKRGRKPKIVVLEEGAEAVAVAAAGNNKGHGLKRKKSGHEADELDVIAKRTRAGEAPEQSIAPVAKMV
jgi:predicted Fe-Mo cluster-binding NifX family protein